MNLKEQVYSVLVVSSITNFNTSIRTLLPDFKFSPVHFEGSVNSARRILLERNFDFIIINSPLPDDTGIRFAIDISHDRSKVSLLFVKTELYTATYNKVAEHGVYLLSKPVSKSLFLQAVDWAITTHHRLKKLEKKTMSIEEKMQEIRIVNRAKWLLIEELKMSEADAHRYIEKQAMDNSCSKREIAEDIIKTYT
ncbi:MAG: ANTAR domain-containing protein [Lachnospiraceae bacterium]|nr:ANTAR domain-containing protein [Lachnospiraceae bacterium]